MPVTPFGPVRLSFRDPSAPLWALLALGLALSLAAGLIALVFAIEGVGRTSAEDLLGVVILGIPLVVGGPLATLFSIYALAFRAEWHLTASHLYRTRGSRVRKSFALAEVAAPTLTEHRRYGQTVGVQVLFGTPTLGTFRVPGVMVPTMDIARAIVAAWRAVPR